MTSSLRPLPPAEVAARLKAGTITLVDIRDPDEFAREHIEGAISTPLSKLETAHLKLHPGRDIVFHCRSGMRTASACDRLNAAVDGEAHVLEGGLDAWKAARLPTKIDAKQPLEIMRQVQIAAGGLVLVGAIAGYLVHPGFYLLSAFVGAGLFQAGLTGWCGMARLLAMAPWNRRAA